MTNKKHRDSLLNPIYDVPDTPGDPGFFLWKAIGAAVCCMIILNFFSSQYVAFRFGYQEPLGTPFLDIIGLKVYAPFDWMSWYVKYTKVQNPMVQTVLSQVLWINLVALVVAVGGVLHFFNKSMKTMNKGSESVHGSAHWASPDEVKQTGLLGTGAGVYIGAWKHPDTGKVHYLRHDGPEHIMAFAPTRSGKGVGLVLPTLLSWPHSAVVYDIKGENWALTAGWRQKDAHNKVLKFEPTATDGSSIRYNPLDIVRLFTDKEVADVQNIMNMIADPEGKGLADHWQKTGHSLLVGTALHVLYAENNKTLAGVIEFLSNPSRTIQDSLNYMLNTDHDMEGVRGWVDTEGKPTFTHPVVAAVARDMLNKAEEEMSSVVSTGVSYLTLYRDPIVARNTACSEFLVPDLMNDVDPVSLYLVVPPSDKDRLKPLIRLVVNQIIRTLVEKMEFKDGRSVAGYKHRLLLLIDEFPSLGKLDIFEESLAFIAGYGLKAYLIIQDISQLHTAYGKDESIFSNCHVRVAYAPNKIETAEMLSKMTGTATIVKQNNSYSGSKYGALGQVSVSTSETQRALLTADEIMRLPAAKKDAQGNVQEAGDMLIFMAGQTPIYGKQILYFTDPVFSQRAKTQCPETSDRIRQPQLETSGNEDEDIDEEADSDLEIDLEQDIEKERTEA